MAPHIIGFFLLIFCVFKGCYMNPYWKLHEGSSYYAGGLWRALIGIPAWVAVISLMIGNILQTIIWLIVTAVLMIIPCIKMAKDQILGLRTIYMLVMASMGTYARIIMTCTLLGIPVCRYTKRAAEVGWGQTVEEFAEANRRRSESAPSSPSFSDILAASMPDPEPVNEEPEVEVFIEQADGTKKKTFTNSDNSMYWDPEKEEFVPIRK